MNCSAEGSKIREWPFFTQARPKAAGPELANRFRFAPMAVVPPIGVGSQQRTMLGHAARAAVVASGPWAGIVKASRLTHERLYSARQCVPVTFCQVTT